MKQANQLIEALSLEPHPEGGYFHRTYTAEQTVDARPQMSSIYYLLTTESPIGHFHRVQADIVHYFHQGDPISYYVIDPGTRALTETVLGPDLGAGEQLQYTVTAGLWKACALAHDGACGYGLISEAVAPGFDYAHMSLGSATDLLQRYPEHKHLIPLLSGHKARHA